MNPAQLNGIWADAVIAGLSAGGVRDVVVSPGSRSTPFALAALRSAGLTCWSVVDERSAAFFALGRAKLSGVPVALLATSGTAPAHYLPAVVEAHLSGCPLVLLTADRPHELVHCGAPQTLEQTRLFDGYVRHAVDLGNPDARPEAWRGAARRALQAVAFARGPRPGPVHLNARAPKPLEPAAASGEVPDPRDPIRSALLAALAAPAAPPRLMAPGEAISALVGRLASAERPWIVCGSLTPSQAPAASLVWALARRIGAVLACETTSQLRFAPRSSEAPMLCDRIEAMLLDASFRAELRPDVLLQLGAAPLGAAWDDWLRPPVERFVLSAHGWPDPTHTAGAMVECDLTLALEALLEQTAPPVARVASLRREYEQAVARAQSRATVGVQATLGGEGAPLTEGAVVDAVLGSLPHDAALVLGSSLALRAVDLFAAAPAAPHPVVAHRGANGIDGLVSTAAGVASSGRPTTLLLGDVSFLHDVGGLWSARHARAPLVIVVLNDGGGRIFEQLPVAATTTPDELTFFTTPQSFDLSHAAALYGHRYRRVRGRRDLAEELLAAHRCAGVTVLDAVLGTGEPAAELGRLRAAMTPRPPPEGAP